MVKNKNFYLIISGILFLVLISGCVKKEVTLVSNNESKMTTTNTDNQTPVKQSDEKERQGEVMGEEDGWKKYSNDYYGIVFEFKDEGNKIGINDESKNRITLSGPVPETLQTDEENNKINTPYAYIHFYKYSNIYGVDSTNFREYLDNAWDVYEQDAKLVSIEEINKKTDFYVVNVLLTNPNTSAEYTKHDYYKEFSEKGEYDYIYISCPEDDLCKQIIENFDKI